MDCPGCPVVLLDTREPEIIGSDTLQFDDPVRVVGCTRLQTTVSHRYVFEASDGNYSGVGVFDPAGHPGAVHDLGCFEMSGKYRGTNQNFVRLEYVDDLWTYELAQNEEGERKAGPEWEPAGKLVEFSVSEWAELSDEEYDKAVKANTDPKYMAMLLSTPEPSPTLEPTPTPEPNPTLEPTPTQPPAETLAPATVEPPSPIRPPQTIRTTVRSTLEPAATPKPTGRPRTSPTPTRISTPENELATAKEYMLGLINKERVKAGVPPVVPGNTRAAQVHAENALSGCFSSHWGLDGTKPYMRYSLAGGYNSNGENASGLGVCIRPGQNYAKNKSINVEVRDTMQGLMNSPGHRRNILYPTHRKANLGIAWDDYNVRVIQHFEGDHVWFERLPELENGSLTFKGELLNGASLDPSSRTEDLGVQIYYDSPLHSFTRGQLARVYSVGYRTHAASVRPPARSGYYYPSDSFSDCGSQYPEPQDIPSDAKAPRTPEESSSMHLVAKLALPSLECAIVPWLDAARWKLRTDSFEVRVDMNRVLKNHGPGIYTIALWAVIDGKSEVFSEYSIFHETEPPDGYGSLFE